MSELQYPMSFYAWAVSESSPGFIPNDAMPTPPSIYQPYTFYGYDKQIVDTPLPGQTDLPPFCCIQYLDLNRIPPLPAGYSYLLDPMSPDYQALRDLSSQPDSSLVESAPGVGQNIIPAQLSTPDFSVRTQDILPSKTPASTKRPNNEITPHDAMQGLIAVCPFRCKAGKLYIYEGTHYKPLTPNEAESRILAICDAAKLQFGSPKFIQDIYRFLTIEPSIRIDDQQIGDYLAFENGLLNIKTGELCPHTPDIFTTYSLRCNYLATNVPSPHYDSFLRQVSGGDPLLMKRIEQIIGCCLVPDMSIKNIFLLQGVGDSGKSAICNLLLLLFTDEATMTLDAHRLDGNYVLADFIDKALCVFSDLPAGPLDSKCTSILKQLCGRDRISSDRKYMDRVQFKNQAKVILATNHPFYSRVKDEAFLKRIITVPFRYSTPKESQIPDFERILFQERDAIVTRAIQEYFELRRNHFVFAGDYAPNEAIDSSVYIPNGVDGSDSRAAAIAHFAAAHTEACTGNTVFMFEAYQAYCELTADTSISLEQFSSHFAPAVESMYHVHKSRMRPEKGKNAQSCITGIRLV